MKRITESVEIFGKKILFEIGDLVPQAHGAAFVKMGGTEILATVLMGKTEKEEMGFFPLTVEYEERYYAAGKIKGPRFMKREGRPSDKAICNARMIDRALRPLFPEELKREVQVIVTVLSWDGENDPDVLGLLGSSLAISLSEIPFLGPVSAVRVGEKEGNFILFPNYQERENSNFDIVFSGVKKEKFFLNMIETGYLEASEEKILKAFDFAVPFLEKLIEFQESLQKKYGKEKIEIKKEPQDLELEFAIKEEFEDKIRKSLEGKDKIERAEFLEELNNQLLEFLKFKFPERISKGLKIFKELYKKVLRENILEKDLRPDGRTPDQLREIEIETGILPRTHGSALFSKGLTKVLSILTLGGPNDVQLLEGMEISGKKRFLHHYNFPPYCSGEIRHLRGPSRREIGHGILAEKALLPVIPSFEEFPYTIRVVSEVLSSNGSTSMGATCAACLALMDGGVPIKKMVAGVGLGMVGKKILVDIQGPEDFFGEMDFKIAGTKECVTALQMDVKILGIERETLKECLEKGKKARIEILEKMEKILPKPKQLSEFAPKVLFLKISPEKIREVIGPGGRVITGIISKFGVTIDIEEDGKIYVSGDNKENVEKAIEVIKEITREIKVGDLFEATVKRLMTFGIIFELFPGQEALLHSSKLKGIKKENYKKIFEIGKKFLVKVDSFDEFGRIRLELVDQSVLKPFLRGTKGQIRKR
jgi:polyribonucleotide nucleotidyltransferase